MNSSDPDDYLAAKKMARSPDPEVRRQLAARGDVRRELLYFLASDNEPEVRREIAANASTPRQADLLLVNDSDHEVRGGLARKIARLAPELPPDRLDQIERMTVDILETLARDQATAIRRILAEELQSVATAPANVINLLARDVELSVCGPVLRHSPILTDEDLIEIIFGNAPDGALSAIAVRAGVGSAVADAIAGSDDPSAITLLLGNPSAQIREETLDRIIDRAPQNEPWHGPLVRRPKLPPRAAARLATFVAGALCQVLSNRTDLGLEAARQIAESVRTRLNHEPAAGTAGPGAAGRRPEPEPIDPPWAQSGAGEEPDDSGANRARRLHAEGKLEEPVINIALAEGDRAFVIAALAELIGTKSDTVDKVLATHNPRAVTSLVWRAGLSMRLARQVQLRLARITPKDALSPRNGTDYPLSERDMIWQLEFFDIP
ncbi:MAG: DUF2336 domain-containing protein [Rhodospirillaceae bacterium]